MAIVAEPPKSAHRSEQLRFEAASDLDLYLEAVIAILLSCMIKVIPTTSLRESTTRANVHEVAKCAHAQHDYSRAGAAVIL